MRVAVIGTGYVGLVSGVCLAEKGHQVTCVDLDARKVESINGGVPPIHEKGLEELLRRHSGRALRATTDLTQAVRESRVSIIAVGTPFDGESIDLTFIRAAAHDIGVALRRMESFHTVVVKSTVVPGTTRDVVLPILEAASGKRAGRDFGVAMNPEFLREGEAVADFLNPDRIVFGTTDAASEADLRELYSVFKGVEQIATNTGTAEMIKYAANSLLATMISFSNEIANLCDATADIDVREVLQGVHLDRRLSPILADGTRMAPPFTTYLEAGCGFGGSCFPKDVKALVAHGRGSGRPMRILDAVLAVNAEQPLRLMDRLRRHYPAPRGIEVTVLGFAFKPGTDDVRESPALALTRSLLEAGARVRGYDPIAEQQARAALPAGSVDFRSSVKDAVDGVDAVFIVTRWPEFAQLPAILDDLGQQPVVIDGRRQLDRRTVRRYEGIGLA